jgi:hypothetical protein
VTDRRPQRISSPAPYGALLKRSPVAAPRAAKAEGKRSPDYLASVRRLPCLHCGMDPSEAAHVRYASAAFGKASGMGKKPESKWVLPLCAEHHRLSRDAQHNQGERQFWDGLGIPALLICEKLWAQRNDFVAMEKVVMVAIAERSKS